MTGTVVWTVPGRSHRPIVTPPARVEVLVAGDATRACAFCPDRYLETPPERARLVLDPPAADRSDPGQTADRSDPGQAPDRTNPAADGAPGSAGAGSGTGPGGPAALLAAGLGALGPDWRVLRDLPAGELGSTMAQFRRIPNLYPILTFEYWRTDHGWEAPADAVARARDYVASPGGRAHLAGLVRARAQAADEAADAPDAADGDGPLARTLGLFASTHDLVVARRHFVDGAITDDQLCSAGDLTPDEHLAFVLLTIDTLADLAGSNPHARYVSVFQNWLRPAGASFDHLHKQLVAIDEWGPMMARVVALLDIQPDLFDSALDLAATERLVIAENEGAVAVAGVGHRYPTIEIYATASVARPWEQGAASVRAISDLLHACHAATGAQVPTNEEWHYRPDGADVAMPWRINLKWRISTLAGFEGGTKINVNTIDPFTVRDRVVARLLELRAGGRVRVARIGDECAHRTGVLAQAERG